MSNIEILFLPKKQVIAYNFVHLKTAMRCWIN